MPDIKPLVVINKVDKPTRREYMICSAHRLLASPIGVGLLLRRRFVVDIFGRLELFLELCSSSS